MQHWYWEKGYNFILPWNHFRASLFLLIFAMVNPEFLLKSTWQNDPVHAVKWLALFLFNAMAIEIYYRASMWGRLHSSRPSTVIPAPTLCCAPWISLLREIPTVGSRFEVYCLNGMSFSASMIMDNGSRAIVVKSDDEHEFQRWMPYEIRPTHWRYLPRPAKKEAAV